MLGLLVDGASTLAHSLWSVSVWFGQSRRKLRGCGLLDCWWRGALSFDHAGGEMPGFSLLWKQSTSKQTTLPAFSLY